MKHQDLIEYRALIQVYSGSLQANACAFMNAPTIYLNLRLGPDNWALLGPRDSGSLPHIA
jgi:hypothetical protein